MQEINQQNLENGVIDYVNNWLSHGAPPQRYDIFSKLTWVMPVAPIELWCLSKENNEWYLWCTQREPTDTVWADEWHNIGSVSMLTDFIGPESEHLIPKLSFLEYIFELAKEDQYRYNLKDPKSRIIQRILRKDSGIKDEDFILELIEKLVYVTSHYDLTPRGAEVVESLVLEATDIKDKFKGGKWIKVTDIPKMIEDKQFVEIQWPRLQKVLDIWMNIK